MASYSGSDLLPNHNPTTGILGAIAIAPQRSPVHTIDFPNLSVSAEYFQMETEGSTAGYRVCEPIGVTLHQCAVQLARYMRQVWTGRFQSPGDRFLTMGDLAEISGDYGIVAPTRYFDVSTELEQNPLRELHRTRDKAQFRYCEFQDRVRDFQGWIRYFQIITQRYSLPVNWPQPANPDGNARCVDILPPTRSFACPRSREECLTDRLALLDRTAELRSACRILAKQYQDLFELLLLYVDNPNRPVLAGARLNRQEWDAYIAGSPRGAEERPQEEGTEG